MSEREPPTDTEGELEGHEELIDDLERLRREVDEMRRLFGDDVIDAAIQGEAWEQDLQPSAIPSSMLPPQPASSRHIHDAARPAAAVGVRRAAVQAALEANLRLQHRLNRLTVSVQRAQDNAANIRQRIKNLRAARVEASQAPRLQPTHRPLEQPLGRSWFWSLPNAPPPPAYPESTEAAQVAAFVPLTFRRWFWAEEHTKALREGVLQRVQERLWSDVVSEMEQQGLGGEGLASFEARIAPIKALKLESPQVVATVASFNENDWATIAHRNLPERSGLDCQLQWQNAGKPGLRNDAFSAEEDAELLRLVETHGQHDWTSVAGALEGGGRRTPLACLSRYQQLLQQSQKVREFPEGDVDRLLALVEKHGPTWKVIADYFGGGFTPDQLMHHWRRAKQRRTGGVEPRKGRWTREENELLLKAVALHDRKWTAVAKLVPGRTDVQCRERYMNVLAPEVRNLGTFSEEEDAKLREAVSRLTLPDGRVKWAEVARELPGRTDRQVTKRWMKLNDLGRTPASTKKRKKPPTKRKVLPRNNQGDALQDDTDTDVSEGDEGKGDQDQEEKAGGLPHESVERDDASMGRRQEGGKSKVARGDARPSHGGAAGLLGEHQGGEQEGVDGVGDADEHRGREVESVADVEPARTRTRVVKRPSRFSSFC